MKLLVAMIAVVFALAACTTTDFQSQLTRSCNLAKPILNALTILDEGGQLSNRNSQRLRDAKVSYDSVCNGGVTDYASAVVTAATVYVVLAKLNKEERVE